MIELVLTHAGAESLELEPDVLTGQIFRCDRHGNIPAYRDKHVLEREAALVVDLRLFVCRNELRVDECGRSLALDGLEDEHTPEHPDLRRSEPGAARTFHEQCHSLDETAQIVVEVLDLVATQSQNGVGVLADLRERKTAAHLALGIGRFIVLGVVLLFDGGIVLLGHGASVLAAYGATPCLHPLLAYR